MRTSVQSSMCLTPSSLHICVLQSGGTRHSPSTSSRQAPLDRPPTEPAPSQESCELASPKDPPSGA